MHTRRTTGSTTSSSAMALAGIVLLVLAGPACEGAKTSAGSSGSGATTGATGASSSGAGDGGTSGGASQGGGTGGTSGRPSCGHVPGGIDWDALEAMCAAAGDAQACESAASDAVFEAAEACAVCVWDDWVPTSLDGSGQCVYGAVEAGCRMVVLGTEGCVGGNLACDPGHMPMWRPDGAGGVQLHVGPQSECFYPADGGPCSLDAEGNVVGDAPPECACLCDPDFPDAP